MSGYEVYKFLQQHRHLIRYLWNNPIGECTCKPGMNTPCFACDLRSLHKDLAELLWEFS